MGGKDTASPFPPTTPYYPPPRTPDPALRLRSRTSWLGLLVTVAVAPALHGQKIDWKTEATFYGDNTEFFTSYRIGETILGGQFQSWLSIRPGSRTELVAGVFGDHRSGSSTFLDPVKPLLGFRYRTENSLGTIGTLVTQNRHGFLEPLEVTTLEFTRPIEYGLQWRERRPWLDGEFYLNWQGLNTPTSREIFDYGLLLAARPVQHVQLEYQGHGLHHGGQLYDAGVPVTNNFAGGFGITLSAKFPLVDSSSLTVYHLQSHGNIDPNAPPGRPGHGQGNYLRAGLTPGGWLDLFMIQWWGTNFLSQEGDNNYNSVGHDSTFYRSDRRYQEYGVRKIVMVDQTVGVDAEFRFHRIDDESSIAIGHSKWEYSYRLAVKVPFSIHVQ